MTRLRRRSAALALSFVAALGVRPSGDAQAQFAVIDPTNLVQNIISALSTAEQVAQFAQQIINMEQQLKNYAQTLKELDPTSYRGVLDAYYTMKSAKDGLLYDVNAISYSAKQVNADFKKLFPEKDTDIRNVDQEKLKERGAAWNTELSNSAKIAMRAQTNLGNVATATQQAERIVSRSQGADGEVRQLQGITQMLFQMQVQLGDIAEMLSTSGRVSATLAATQASKDMVTREGKRRRRENYANPGRPPKVLNKFP
jgi:P-type conjugative transfer protein TrbJ